MASVGAELKALNAVAECEPASRIGAHLLERYHGGVHFRGSPSRQWTELAVLRELCLLVEQVPFTQLSVRALLDAASLHAPTPAAAARRRTAVHRLIRLLQYDGVLPGRAELRAGERLAAELERTPDSGRATLRRWLARRQRQCSPHNLSWEATKLRTLEELLPARSGLSDGELITEWLRGLVRDIVDCSCAPVTRARFPDRCEGCGATIETDGSRASPGPGYQAVLRSLASKYLQFRRLPTPTRDL
jgi:hypothetical protein